MAIYTKAVRRKMEPTIALYDKRISERDKKINRLYEKFGDNIIQ